MQAFPNLPISLTSWHNSPFVIGPPITEPSQFFGREYILKRIFDVWKYMPLQHIA
ncbi:MAG: ATP-binding protein, partial [Proteobacteria bacterium]|nr:ATP-binding protein [Pseudomonadota bacterium]